MINHSTVHVEMQAAFVDWFVRV